MEIRLPTAQQSERLLAKTQMPSNQLKLISRNKDKLLLWFDTDRKIVYAVDNVNEFVQRTKIYASYDYGDTWQIVFTSPYGINKFRTLKSGYHIAFNTTAKLLRIAPDFSSSQLINTETTVKQPINSESGIAEKDGVIIFSEYSANASGTGTNCRLYKSVDDGKTWTVSREGTDIRHWHSVQVDPYTGYLWACAGDNTEESKIVVSKDNGATWETVASGSQAIRAVGLVFTHEAIYWGSDTTVSPKIHKAKKTDVPLNVVVLGDIPNSLSMLGSAKGIDGTIVGWTRVETTNNYKEAAQLILVQNDTIKAVQNFTIKPKAVSTLPGFTLGSNVDDNNVFFVQGVDITMDGLLGFVLPLTSQ